MQRSNAVGCLMLGLGMAAAGVGAVPAGGAAPLDLQVDGRRGWVVTDDPEPRLTWAPRGALPGLVAWRVRVEREDGDGGAAWRRERRVPAAEGPWLVLADLPQASRARFRWQVSPEYGVDAVDGGGVSKVGGPATTPDAVPSWTGPAEGRFETGLRAAADWQGTWIGLEKAARGRAAVWFRRAFALGKPVVRARLYVCGLGWQEAWLNGRRLGDGVLEPAQTDYERRLFYTTHDVTASLQAGENVLGVWVGDGWFNQDRVWGPKGLSYGEPRLRAQLEIELADGTRTVVATDGAWTAAPSAVTAANVYHGEDYDARREQAGWCRPGPVGEGWRPVRELPAPGGSLVAAEVPPCRRQRFLPVRAWTEPKPGVWVADFGQNLTGWTRLRVRASPGARVTLRFAESLAADGGIDPLSTGVIHTKQVQTDTYVCRGGGVEEWEPRFTYHVFQYAELTVAEGRLEDGAPGPELLTGVAVYTDMPVRGDFACSDPVIQRAYELAEWTLAGNVQGIPTDCPGREKCGWTGDAHLLTPFALQRFDGVAFWSKYLGDIVTSAAREGTMLMFGRDFGDRRQGIKAAGLPTMIAPGRRSSGAASPDWGSAVVFIPWDVYRLTGDRRLLERHYGLMRQWVEHLRAQAEGHIVSSGLGDWCTPWRADAERPSEPRAYYARIVPELSTACYWRSTDLLARSAALLGREEDARNYRSLADDIAAAYRLRFFDTKRGRFADQTVNAIALGWGLLPAADRAGVAAALALQIAEDGDHFYTGVFGLASLFDALGGYGQEATIARIFANPRPPGFRHLLAQGATTCWETWPTAADTGKSFERSKSHPFQGAWASWCFEGLAGIQTMDTEPGYRRLRLAPRLVPGVTWARAVVHTAMGRAESDWRREGGRLVWTVEVPPGARAEVSAPGPLEEVLGSGSPRPLVPRAGAERVELAPGRHLLHVRLGSGDASSPQP